MDQFAMDFRSLSGRSFAIRKELGKVALELFLP